jgi:hypothetical protein
MFGIKILDTLILLSSQDIKTANDIILMNYHKEFMQGAGWISDAKVSKRKLKMCKDTA